MITPLIMLLLLTLPWLLDVGRAKWTGKRTRRWVRRKAGRIGLASLFVWTGIGHFLMTEGMVEMLPAWLPLREAAVYASGVLEILAAAAVLHWRTRRLAGWAMIVLLITFLPVNAWAALNHTGLGGHQWGPVYLWIRVPLQVFIAGWAWWFAARPPDPPSEEEDFDESLDED